MKQDTMTGLWVPDSYSPKRAPFPPVLDLPDDHKVPRRIENLDRDATVRSGGACYGSDLPWTKA